jgi:hypothetical protein
VEIKNVQNLGAIVTFHQIQSTASLSPEDKTPVISGKEVVGFTEDE